MEIASCVTSHTSLNFMFSLVQVSYLLEHKVTAFHFIISNFQKTTYTEYG
jgi:hypothetical protein